MEDSNNVMTENEKLFGKPTIMNIFDEDEDYYNGLRQQIINSPKIDYTKNHLPFSDIEILPYLDYLLTEEVKKVKANGYRVFFLKQSTLGKEDYCYAAGYYLNTKKKFNILRYSRISAKDYFAKKDTYLLNKRKSALINKTEVDKEQLFLNKDVTCDDPRMGACIVTGKRVEMNIWRDSRNNPPSAYYRDIELSALDNPLLSRQNDNKETSFIKNPKKHYFYIKKGHYINAYGYFDPETKYFYIGKDSTIRQFLSGIPENSELANNRKRLIDRVGAKQLFCWKIIKDAKCRNAETAASYVLGCKASFDQWHDDNGLTLDEVYPELFNNMINLSPRIITILGIIEALKKRKHQEVYQTHHFYIRRYSETNYRCNASGFYDPSSKSFVLLKDSIFSLEATSLFNYSAEGVQRRLFINKNCVKQHDGYRLKHDVISLSPSQAASYVLGNTSELGLEWVDAKGLTLLEVYN